MKSNKVIPHPGTLLSPSTAHPLQIEICKKKKKSSPCFPPQSNSPCCLCKAAQLKLQSEPHRLHSMTELCGPQGCQSLLRQGTCRPTFFFYLPLPNPALFNFPTTAVLKRVKGGILSSQCDFGCVFLELQCTI